MEVSIPALFSATTLTWRRLAIADHSPTFLKPRSEKHESVASSVLRRQLMCSSDLSALGWNTRRRNLPETSATFRGRYPSAVRVLPDKRGTLRRSTCHTRSPGCVGGFQQTVFVLGFANAPGSVCPKRGTRETEQTEHDRPPLDGRE
jgi:hypothetical protein